MNGMMAAQLGLTDISAIPINISIINSTLIMSSTIFSKPPPTHHIYSIIPPYSDPFVCPSQSAMVRGIIEEYNRQKSPASSAEMIQSHHTNPPSSKIPATNSVTVPPTILTQNTKSYSVLELLYNNPNDPSLGNPFETEEGIKDWKALAIHYHTRVMLSAKPSSPRVNYGGVPPPLLHLEKKLEICSYEMWKENWLSFFQRTQMPDRDGLSFLNEQSIPCQNSKTSFQFVTLWKVHLLC